MRGGKGRERKGRGEREKGKGKRKGNGEGGMEGDYHAPQFTFLAMPLAYRVLQAPIIVVPSPTNKKC